MGNCFGVNVVVLYIRLSPLTRLTQCATYTIDVNARNERIFSCADEGAGASDICLFHCNSPTDTKNDDPITFDCNTVSECRIICDDSKCLDSSTITASNAAYLNATAKEGANADQCFKSANIALPDSGNADFTLNQARGFKNMALTAGTNTQDITIDCTYGIGDNPGDECMGLKVYASTARYLHISSGLNSGITGEEKKDSITWGIIECPQGSSYAGVACVIDLSGGGFFQYYEITTLNGIPMDVYIEPGSTTMSEIYIDCTGGLTSTNSGNSFVGTDCYNTRAPTLGGTRDPTRSPTALPSASPVTVSPTQTPSAAPVTSSPTGAVTNSPTGSPSETPSSHPTGSPITSAPTVSPSRFPSVSPSYIPSVSPVRSAEREVNEGTTYFPSVYNTQGGPGKQVNPITGDVGEIDPIYYVLGGVAGLLICFLCVIIWCFCIYKKRAKRAKFDEENTIKTSSNLEHKGEGAGNVSIQMNKPPHHMEKVNSVEALDIEEEEEQEAAGPGSPKANNNSPPNQWNAMNAGIQRQASGSAPMQPNQANVMGMNAMNRGMMHYPSVAAPNYGNAHGVQNSGYNAGYNPPVMKQAAAVIPAPNAPIQEPLKVTPFAVQQVSVVVPPPEAAELPPEPVIPEDDFPPTKGSVGPLESEEKEWSPPPVPPAIPPMAVPPPAPLDATPRAPPEEKEYAAPPPPGPPVDVPGPPPVDVPGPPPVADSGFGYNAGGGGGGGFVYKGGIG
eukprot:490460_1